MPGSLPGPAGAATIVKNEAVKEFLVRQIESALGPHDRLPTERELAERFGISRMTVRRALDRLELEGRVYRVQGAGTFVAPYVRHQDVRPHLVYRGHAKPGYGA